MEARSGVSSQDVLRIYQSDATVRGVAEGKKNPLGPTGERTQEVIASLRSRRGLSFRELSDRLTELGRPVPTLGLARIEKGERRVDVDDLVALALALEASPNTLMLPPDADPGQDVALTSELSVDAWRAWRWARGEPGGETVAPDPHVDAITASGVERGRELHRRMQERRLDFARNRPDVGAEPPASEIGAQYGRLQEIWLAASALADETGWPIEVVLRLAQGAAIEDAEPGPARKRGPDGGR